MIDVYTWEPSSNSGEPFFVLCEKGVPFTYPSVDRLELEQHDAAEVMSGLGFA